MKIGLFLTLAWGTLTAMPVQPAVVSGEAHFNLRDSVLEITATDRTILEWGTFQIAEGETVRFFLPNKKSSILNRVRDLNSSRILGRVEGNGQIVLVHSSGILFEGAVEAGSLIASTLDLRNDSYLSRGMVFDLPSRRPIIQRGTIAALKGDAILLGHCVENEGAVSAVEGIAALAGVGSATVTPNGLLASPGQAFEVGDRGNFLQGAIQPDWVSVAPYENKVYPRAVNQENGTVSGRTVYLLGTDVWLKDHSRAEGEVIYAGAGPVQASKVFLGREAELEAAGGAVYLFGKDANQFLGTISVGDGFANIDSNGHFIFLGTVHGTLVADLRKVSQIPSIDGLEEPYTTLPYFHPPVQVPEPILPR